MNGSICFQHNFSAGLAPVAITLRVTNGPAESSYSLQALPFEGNISLVSNSCLVVVQGSEKLLLPSYLSSTTDFENQDPTIAYRVLSPMAQGHLEVYEPIRPNSIEWHWIRSDLRSKRSNLNFTQDEINQGHVRLQSSAGVVPLGQTFLQDSFQFRVYSSQLAGPEGLFCIRILSPVKPTLVVATANVSLDEGGTVLVNGSSFSLSFSSNLSLLQELWDEAISPERIEMEVFISNPPQNGTLMVSGTPLSGNTIPLAKFLDDSVTYKHDDLESFIDRFSFYLRPTSVGSLPLLLPDPTGPATLWFNIHPINDNPPTLIQTTPISLVEGSYVILNSSTLKVEDLDRDTNPASISIVILPSRGSSGEASSNCFFAQVGNIDERTNQFQYSEVLQGQIVFRCKLSTNGALRFQQGVHISDGKFDIQKVRRLMILYS